MEIMECVEAWSFCILCRFSNHAWSCIKCFKACQRRFNVKFCLITGYLGGFYPYVYPEFICALYRAVCDLVFYTTHFPWCTVAISKENDQMHCRAVISMMKSETLPSYSCLNISVPYKLVLKIDVFYTMLYTLAWWKSFFGHYALTFHVLEHKRDSQ